MLLFWGWELFRIAVTCILCWWDFQSIWLANMGNGTVGYRNVCCDPARLFFFSYERYRTCSCPILIVTFLKQFKNIYSVIQWFLLHIYVYY